MMDSDEEQLIDEYNKTFPYKVCMLFSFFFFTVDK